MAHYTKEVLGCASRVIIPSFQEVEGAVLVMIVLDEEWWRKPPAQLERRGDQREDHSTRDSLSGSAASFRRLGDFRYITLQLTSLPSMTRLARETIIVEYLRLCVLIFARRTTSKWGTT